MADLAQNVSRSHEAVIELLAYADDTTQMCSRSAIRIAGDVITMWQNG
jgi:hypothetical protein